MPWRKSSAMIAEAQQRHATTGIEAINHEQKHYYKRSNAQSNGAL
jgi:hypothetical protein